MTPVNPAAEPGACQQAAAEAALLVLERMGLSPADLQAIPQARPQLPTFAEYIPVVSVAVSDGCRRAYGSYWNRIIEHWGSRRLDEPTPSEVRQLMTYVKTHVVARRNARGGRSAAEHLIAALRCLYARAADDGLISEADNPARKVAKRRRLPSTRRSVISNSVTRRTSKACPSLRVPDQPVNHFGHRVLPGLVSYCAARRHGPRPCAGSPALEAAAVACASRPDRAAHHRIRTHRDRANDANFNINLLTMHDKSRCLGAVRSGTTGGQPDCHRLRVSRAAAPRASRPPITKRLRFDAYWPP